jgi:transcriptional regulator with XRE-family HTH domain
MSLNDISARMKQAKEAKDTLQKKEFDPAEAYRIRSKMLGVLLRDARLSTARTLEDCARLLRITPHEVEAWEYGEGGPSLPQLEILAYYLDVPVSHFWGTETMETSRGRHVDAQTEYVSLRNRMIGALLRQAREEAGLSLDDLSQATHIPVEQLNHYELGELALPMTELTVLALAFKKNMDYFLETSGHIGELLATREEWKHFASLPPDLREFAANPLNMGFIEIALAFSQMPTDKLRRIGESVLDITR